MALLRSVRMEHDERTKKHTKGLWLKTAREIRNLFCEDGDWTLRKLGKSYVWDFLGDPKQPDDSTEERVLYSLRRDLDKAMAGLKTVSKQWQAITNQAEQLQESQAEPNPVLLPESGHGRCRSQRRGWIPCE